MNKSIKNLFTNIGLLMIGNFTSKILVFILVPFYTRILSVEEYGIFDIFYSTIQLLFPILTINIIDGVMRFSIDASVDNQRKIFSIGLRIILFSIFLIIIGSFLFSQLFNNEIIQQYRIEFILFYISYSIVHLLNQFARGLNDVKGCSISGVISTLIMLIGNLLFLLVFKIGLVGYFYAYILSLLVPSIFLVIRNNLFQYCDKKIIFNFKIEDESRKVILYSIPLIFDTLSWNIINVSDRYAVILLRGIEENGLYSVAYKIPAILNAFQVIFIQAWQLSIVKEFNEGQQYEEFYEKIYNGCHVIMISICFLLIFCTKFLSKILFAKEFYFAWYYVPTLLLYIVFNTLSGTIGGVFSAKKDGKTIAITTFSGAFTNIILNIILVFYYGAEGAAIASVISSIIIWSMRVLLSKKYINCDIKYKKHIFSYLTLIFQAFIMTRIESNWTYIIQLFLLIILIVMNHNYIFKVMNTLFNNPLNAIKNRRK